jgi:TetR/AcrR family acrAB operon transcriptional repressor
MRRTKEQAEETKRAILKAAETLFLEKGYESVSLDEIACAADVTRGAVHWHFRNKQGLLFAIREEMRMPMEELADRLSADTTLAPLDALAEVMSATFRRLQADPRQRRLLKVLLNLDSTDADDSNRGNLFEQRLRASLQTVFEAVARTRKMPAPWTPASAAMAFQATVSGLVNEWARGKTDFELVPDAEAIMRTILLAWDVMTRPEFPELAKDHRLIYGNGAD